jgi:hypothetical protein
LGWLCRKQGMLLAYFTLFWQALIPQSICLVQ